MDRPLPPLPLPAPTRSHGTLTSAVHGQLAEVLIVVVTAAAGMHGLKSTGATEYWQIPTSPLCRTVNVRSASEMAPLRDSTSVWRATVYDTLPVP